MKILFIADARSPIALNWIRYFVEAEDEVHIISTFPAEVDFSTASFEIIPTAFARAAGTTASGSASKKSILQHYLGRFTTPLIRAKIRHWLGPLTLAKPARTLAMRIKEINPDLVHAMRIPYEAMLAALAFRQFSRSQPPLCVSVWGNDFTLHARAAPLMPYLTRTALKQASALHTDCYRDVRLAHEWGFDRGKPFKVLPGAGGLQKNIFFPPVESAEYSPIVINPRGIRAYIRNDTFFKAIPLVLQAQPKTRFICPAMAGENAAETWLQELNIAHAVTLLPRLSRQELAEFFRSAPIVVSPSTHDGTPNTLLEAMACGCFPIAGDLESIREWITPGENGFLIDPGDPQKLATSILKALADPDLRAKARQKNTQLIAQKAEYQVVMAAAKAFYQTLF